MARVSFFSRYHGTQYDGIVHCNHDSASGLASNTPGFERDGATTVLERFLYRIHSDFLQHYQYLLVYSFRSF
ncbi:hypothetical protein HSBAA_05520 [Vreelandella sulfidaeris]|uniref:Uncharacterized protein n=1 Tax=Vreelandella sulfidaeris TaxID=115553 RepID=A0A455U068_9GAMM|nr:hypothetical protein HSBAA_05520 [Halomonas sulfidaeris]